MSSLIPAVLNSGDSYGYMQMEFPVLNLLAGLGFWILDSNKLWLANLILLLVHFCLSLANFHIWRGIRLNNFLNIAPAFLILSFFSTFDQYYSRFMPDVSAHLLILLALGLSWKKPRFFLSSLLFSLGILMKPNAAIGLGLALLHPQFSKSFFVNLPWVVFGLGSLYAYYHFGLEYIAKLQTLPSLFKVGGLSPGEGLLQFITKPYEIFLYFLQNLCGRYGIILLAIVLYKNPFLKWPQVLSVFFVSLIQILTVVLVSGDHVFIHDYYLLGAGLLPIALLLQLVEQSPRAWIKWLFIALCFGRLCDICLTELRITNLFSNNPQNNTTLWPQCHELKTRNPNLPWNQNFVFRNEGDGYPKLGLCFGERSHSETSSFGFAVIPLNTYDQKRFQDCSTIDQTTSIALFTCPKLP